ncbi:MAG: hypothetical protein RL748_4119, partial [Pseudomonadota bacterium]|jgi:hypothetical protein
LLETLDNTEIAVHDSGQRLTSLMFYEGGAGSNRITIGRDMGGGWGTVSNLVLNGSVGVGTKLPNARLSVVAPGANELGGSAKSTALLVSAGTLGNTAGNELSLASIGFFSGNNSYLGVRAYRTVNGGDWGSTSIGLGMDVDNTVRAGASLWLHASTNVGIGTATPAAKLEVAGDFIRKIVMKTGLGPSDGIDNGRIVSRTLAFTKRYPDTAIRIFYCDNLRVNGDNSAARWEIRVDGATVPGGALIADKYGNNGNRHDPTTVFGYATGVSAGAHEIQIWVGPIPGWGLDAYTGWLDSRWTIEAQEVWL